VTKRIITSRTTTNTTETITIEDLKTIEKKGETTNKNIINPIIKESKDVLYTIEIITPQRTAFITKIEKEITQEQEDTGIIMNQGKYDRIHNLDQETTIIANTVENTIKEMEVTKEILTTKIEDFKIILDKMEDLTIKDIEDTIQENIKNTTTQTEEMDIDQDREIMEKSIFREDIIKREKEGLSAKEGLEKGADKQEEGAEGENKSNKYKPNFNKKYYNRKNKNNNITIEENQEKTKKRRK
jgi:hypothetical protein